MTHAPNTSGFEGKLRPLTSGRICRTGQNAILQHAVVVETNRHEHDVTRTRGIEA